MRACSESGLRCDEVLELVVLELSEERDEEGDNVREGPFWVAEVGEK